MQNSLLKHLLLFAAICFLGVSLLTSEGLLLGDENKAAEVPPVKKKVRARQRGRLPAHYRTVVTKTQREKIYAIQSKYKPKLDDLLAQIKELRAKQSEEVEALLSKDQKSQIAKLREEAAQKRAKRNQKPKTMN